jgi:hypothetical protein
MQIKTTRMFHLTHQNGYLQENKQKCWGSCGGGGGNPYTLLVRMYISAVTMEINMKFPYP